MASWVGGGVAVVGGQNGSVALGDVWRWAGTDWTQDARPGLPPTYRHVAVYRDVLGAAVLTIIGGYQAGQMSTTIWSLGPGYPQWLPTYPTGGPGWRSYAAGCWDGTRVLVHGGWDGWGPTRDLWAWSGATWTLVDDGLDVPVQPSRRSHGLAWHPGRAKLVVFGGVGDSGYLAEPWEWSLSGGWVQGPAGPEARSTPVLAFDGLRIILYGGERGFPNYYRDTWRYVIPQPPIGQGPVSP